MALTDTQPNMNLALSFINIEASWLSAIILQADLYHDGKESLGNVEPYTLQWERNPIYQVMCKSMSQFEK